MKSIYWTYFLITSLIAIHPLFANDSGEGYTYANISGKVLDEKTGAPVEYASIVTDHELWAVTNEKGEFVLKNVPESEVHVTISCLGYAKKTFGLNVSGDRQDVIFYLPQDNLLLTEVVVTAKNKPDEMSTSYIIDRVGLDHLQMSGVADVMSLLPGGQTNRSLHLAGAEQRVALRAASSGENGNPTFGTAVEVDGTRLSNNASINPGTTSSLYGVDTRNIATANIESVELITGIPSVAYGDLTGGVVKINTRKGKSPLQIEMATKPNTKQVSANKGFGLGKKAGILNASIEYIKSIADLSSPYTSYDRNGFSLFYSNTLDKKSNPLTLTLGITGNTGGYDRENDPDAFVGTYTKERDNILRLQSRANYLLNKSWITSLEVAASINYSDQSREERTNKSSSVSVPVIRGKEEGYFVANVYDENPNAAIVLIPRGYWYQTSLIDNKPVDLSANIKARWAKKTGNVSNNILAGVDFSRSGNKGKGETYSDLRYAPTWREYRYDLLPYMNNLAFYLEDKMTLPVNESVLQLMAGVRLDVTSIGGSEYGTVSGTSPRFNAKYIVFENRKGFVERLNVYAGWGKSLKLPSFTALYPEPSYRDILSFAPGTMADGSTFYAYYIMPTQPRYNPNLRWQHAKQTEIGMEARIKGATIHLTAFYNKTLDSYRQSSEYLPFTYKFTGQSALENFPIPSENRQYTINQATGVVTVSDKTGEVLPRELAYTERNTFRSVREYDNATPITRKGIEWIVTFDKIQSIGTTFRLDGSYYNYRATEESLEAYSPLSQNMADGNPYKYVGIYVGGNNTSNGSETRKLNMNLTVTTHIPVVRLIFSLKIEGSLYNYTQRLSEYQGNVRGFALDDRYSLFPAADSPGDIYNTSRYVAIYPVYYVSHDDMDTRIPFTEKFTWAKENDQVLYNELAKLVSVTNNDYLFDANRVSGYYSANISITKEISDIASLSFNATNFTNNMQLVKTSDTGFYTTTFKSGYIPNFYYGLSLRLKIK